MQFQPYPIWRADTLTRLVAQNIITDCGACSGQGKNEVEPCRTCDGRGYFDNELVPVTNDYLSIHAYRKAVEADIEEWAQWTNEDKAPFIEALYKQTKFWEPVCN